MKLSLGRNDYLTIAGALMAAAGAFMPMIDLARINKMSYVDAAGGQAYILVALALLAAVLIFLDKRKLSLFAAVGAWVVLLWPVLKRMGGGSSDSDSLLGKITDAAADPIQRAAEEVTGKLFSNFFNFELGGYVFFAGMLLLLVGGIMNFMSKK